MQKIYIISIPSGAIKSTDSLKIFLTNFQISIPSGAIKSELEFGSLAWLCSFQFLLVRLRAMKTKIEIKIEDKFQFLLVRLRVTSDNYLCEIPQFQFLLVRLRGGTKRLA